MQVDANWTELRDLLAGLIVDVPGVTLNDKTGLLANIFGIAGFLLSVGIVVARLLTQRGKRRPATQADLDRLGASIVASFQDRIVDQLVAGELGRFPGSQLHPSNTGRGRGAHCPRPLRVDNSRSVRSWVDGTFFGSWLDVRGGPPRQCSMALRIVGAIRAALIPVLPVLPIKPRPSGGSWRKKVAPCYRAGPSAAKARLVAGGL